MAESADRRVGPSMQKEWMRQRLWECDMWEMKSKEGCARDSTKGIGGELMVGCVVDDGSGLGSRISDCDRTDGDLCQETTAHRILPAGS